jgi:pimeloyl-ACP methyl ester carboxylesterase
MEAVYGTLVVAAVTAAFAFAYRHPEAYRRFYLNGALVLMSAGFACIVWTVFMFVIEHDALEFIPAAKHKAFLAKTARYHINTDWAYPITFGGALYVLLLSNVQRLIGKKDGEPQPPKG